MTIQGIDFDFTDLIKTCARTEANAYNFLGLGQNPNYKNKSIQEALRDYYSFKQYLPKGLTGVGLRAAMLVSSERQIADGLYNLGTRFIYFKRKACGRLLSIEQQHKPKNIHFSNPMSLAAANDFAKRYVEARNAGNFNIMAGIIREIMILFAESLRQDVLTNAQTNAKYWLPIKTVMTNAHYFIPDILTDRSPSFKVTFNDSLMLNFFEDITVENDGFPYGIEIKSDLNRFKITSFDLSKEHTDILKQIEDAILTSIYKHSSTYFSQEYYEIIVPLNLDLLDDIVKDILAVKYDKKRLAEKLFFITTGNRTLLGSEFFNLLDNGPNDVYLKFGEGSNITVDDKFSPDEVLRDDLTSGNKKFSNEVLEGRRSILYNDNLEDEEQKKIQEKLVERVAKRAMQKLNQVSLWYGKP